MFFLVDQDLPQMILGGISHPPQENLFCAFALARVAAAMRVDHMERALGLFDLAKKKIQDGELGGAEMEIQEYHSMIQIDLGGKLRLIMFNLHS